MTMGIGIARPHEFSLPYKVTCGLEGSPFFLVGFSNTASIYGSIDPTSIIVSGEALETLNVPYSSPSYDLNVGFNNADSSAAQDDFFAIQIIDTSGVLRTYYSADATFSPGGPTRANWTWGTGSDPIWVVGDNGNSFYFNIW